MKHTINTTVETVQREFEGLPVKEATHELPMIIMPEDIARAQGQQKDFGHCVFANTCARQYNAEKIAIMRTVAYVSMPDGKGNKVVYRYKIPEDAREVIENFDKGEKVEPGATYYLQPPSEGQKLENIRRKKKESKKRKKRYLQGEMTVEEEKEFEELSEINREKAKKAVRARKKNGEYNKKADVYELDVRHGTGAVGFSRKRKNQ